MLNQLVELSRSVSARKRKRLTRLRREMLGNQVRRSQRLEALERRLLLASDVTLGLADNGRHDRILGVGEVVYTPTADDAVISVTNIIADLEAGLNVTIDTINGGGTQLGDITIAETLQFTNPVTPTLRLNADRHIGFVGVQVGPLDVNGTLDLVLNSDRDQATTLGGYVTIDALTVITTNGGDVTVGGGTDPNVGFAQGDATTLVGFEMEGLIDSAAGNVSIRARGVDGVANDDVFGIDLFGGAQIFTTSGNVTLEGIGGNGTGNGGVGVVLQNAVVSTLDGSVSIMGDGRGSGLAGIGVFLADGGQATTNSGALSVMGMGSATGGAQSDGIVLQQGVNVISSLTGEVTISGASNAGSSGLRSGDAGVDIIESIAGSLTIGADSIALDDAGGATSVQGSGSLLIQPLQLATTIGLGGGIGDLQLSATEIGMIADGFSSITIGDSAFGAGAVAVDTVTFTDPVTIAGGSVTVNNGLSSTGGLTLLAVDAATAGQDVVINSGTVTDTTNDVIIEAGDSFSIAAGASITAPGVNAEVSITVDPVDGDADPEGGSTSLPLGATITASAVTFIGGDNNDTFSVPSSDFPLLLDGGLGDDTFIVDFAGGIPAGVGAVDIAGGVGGNDTLSLVGGNVTTTTYNYLNANDGSVNLDTAVINYTGLDPITSTVNSANVVLQYSIAAESIDISQAAGSITVDSSAGEMTTFVDPTNQLFVDTGGGADTVTISSAVTTSLPSGFFISDPDNDLDDVIVVDGTLTNTAGEVSFLSADATVNADILADAEITIFGIVGSGSVLLDNVTLDSGSDTVEIDQPITLTGDVVITANLDVVISSTIDGNQALTISGDTVNLAGLVGGTTPLASIDVTSSGIPATIQAGVTTNGNQQYNSAVLTGTGAVGFVSQDAGSNITFASRLDGLNLDDSEVTINSAGLTSFGDEVGGSGRLLSLTVDTQGPLTVPQVIDAVNSIALTITDTSAATDALTIPATARIQSAAGDVTLTSGDSVLVDSTATINAAAGTIAINVDPVAGDADGEGGTVTVPAGTALNFNVLNFSGGGDGDLLNLADFGADYNVDGGDGTDVIVLDMNGTFVNVSESEIEFSFTNVSSITSIEGVSVTNSSSVTFDGTAGDDVFTSLKDPVTTEVTTTLGSGFFVTADRATTQIRVDGGPANDTLVYDISNGIPGRIDFSGGLRISPLEQVIIQGSLPVNSLEFGYFTENDGTVSIDGVEIVNYVGITPLTSTVTAADVELNYSGGSETIDVTQVGTDITVDSTIGEITTFVAPTNNLIIDTGSGTDTINIEGLNFTPSGTFSIVDPDTDDTLNFQTAASTLSVVDFGVPNVNINQDLTVSDELLLGPVGTGTITAGATITSGVGVRFFQPVGLTGDTTVITNLGATGSVIFDETVDGAANLAITDRSLGGTSFGGAVGQTTALTSLSVTADSGITIASSIDTDGAQTFDGPVLLGGNVTLTSATGTIAFDSSIDAGAALQNLTINSGDTTTLSGPVGDTLPPDLFSVNSGAALSVQANVTAENQVNLRTIDSANAGEDITIVSPAVITSNASNVFIDAGDNVDFQFGASIVAAGNAGIFVDVADADGGTGSTINVSGSITAVAASVFGGPDVDTLNLDGTATDLTFGLTDVNQGNLIRDTTAFNYQTIEVIDSAVLANNVTVNFSPLAETISTTTVPLGRTDINSDVSTTQLTFDSPSNDLTFNTGGGVDNVVIDGLDLSFGGGTSGTFAIDDPDGPTDDTVTFTGNASLTFGSIDVSVPQIEILTDLTADGGILLGDATGTGEIRTSAVITSAQGDIFFEERVNLVGQTDVRANATLRTIAFDFPINGTQDLTVIGSDLIQLNQEVGQTTPLATLLVQASGPNQSITLNNVTTTGAQSYGSPGFTNAGGDILLFTSTLGGDITFTSIDNGSAPPDGIDIDTTGEVRPGIVGAQNPISLLSITGGEAFTFFQDATVLGNIDISLLDTATRNEAFTIVSPATITTGGDLNISVGDTVFFQPGATILAANGTVNVRADQPDLDPLGTQMTINSDITTLGGVFLEGTDNPDDFTVTLQTTTAFNINGNDPTMAPGDTLMVDAAGADVVIDAGTGAITVTGLQPFTPNGIEEVALSNIGTLTINGDAAVDTVAITRSTQPSQPNTDLITINGNSTLAVENVTSLTYNGGDGDDQLIVDATNGLPVTPITFNGQGQDGANGGDFLQVTGTFTTQTFDYTAPGIDGNAGTVDLDGTVITYTGLEPIVGGDSTDTILNFNTGLSNNATLQAHAALGSLEIIDNGATFEDTVFNNPTNSLTINLGNQGDILNVGTLDPDYAASMIINGGTGVDNVQLNAVTISFTPGRALDVADVETLGITGSTFENNTADVGGALRVVGGVTTIDSSTFTGNTATGDAADQGGGAIFTDSDMTIQNGTVISMNRATGIAGSGGGIFVGDLGTLTVLDSTLQNNQANRAGGGIEAESGADMTLVNVTLLNNFAGVVAAPGNGGGLHITGTRNVDIVGGTISQNGAAAEGGGLWNDQGTMTITGTLIQQNTAQGDLDPAGVPTDLQGGGGIFNNGGTLNLNDAQGAVTIQGNQASGATRGSGGGIMSIGGDVNILGAVITTNEAVRAGGGIEIIEGTVTLESTNLINNDVSGDDLLGAGLGANPGNGGGLHVTGAADVTIRGGQISGNFAEAEGGGLWNSATGTMTIDSAFGETTTITGNLARGDAAPGATGADVQGGGGIFNNGGTLDIIGDNTVITGNAASGASNGSGGGILSVGGDVTINNTDLSTNEAVRAGGGIEIVAGTVLISNATIAANDVSADDLLGLGLGASPGNGGGLHVTADANVTVTGVRVENNVAEAEGGGLWNSATGTLTLDGVQANPIPGTIFLDLETFVVDPDGEGPINAGDPIPNGTILDDVFAPLGLRLESTGGGGVVTIDAAGNNIGLAQPDNPSNILFTLEDPDTGDPLVTDRFSLTTDILPVPVETGRLSGFDINGVLLQTTGDQSTPDFALNTPGIHTILFEVVLGNPGIAIDNISFSAAFPDISVTGNLARGDQSPAAGIDQIQGGGGIFNNGGTLDIIGDVTTLNVNIGGNAASGPNNGSGGGILSIGGNVTIEGSVIGGNEAVRAGGGIEVVEGTVTITSTVIAGNDVSEANLLGLGLLANPGNGGGLHVTGAANVSLDASDVIGNTAGREGGGLWNNTGTMTLVDNVLIDGNVASGDAADDGGGGIFNNGGTLNVNGTGTTISNNLADGLAGSGGGIFNAVGGTLTITDATIVGSTANRAGGGIEDASGATTTVTLTNVTLSNNNTGVNPAVGSPGNGGGLHVTGDGNVTVDGGFIENNVAALEGGGLWNGTGTMTITGGALINANVASGDAADDGGGGIFNNGGTLIINDVDTTISNNIADGVAGSGGGVFNAIGGTLTITDSTITGNVANRAGGGIEDASGAATAVTLTNITLTNNNAGVAPAVANPGNGGGLHISGDGNLTVDGGTVQSNSAALEGGGLWNSVGTLTVQNGTLVDSNTASGDSFPDDGGGGIFNNGGTLIITGATTTISNNEADGTGGTGGGILSISGGDVSITDANITGNTSAVDGGGLFADGVGGQIELLRVTFMGNTAQDSGGGALIQGATATVTDSTFNNNNAVGLGIFDGAGGGLFVGGEVGSGAFTLTNTNFTLNTALGGGGGANFNDADGTITGGTFANNTVNGTGITFDSGAGGIGILGETRVANVAIADVTVDGNTSTAAGGIGAANAQITVATSTISNNRSTDALGGAGGIGVIDNVGIVGNVLEVRESLINGNATAGEGGGIGVLNGAVLIVDTNIVGNSADGGRGGGIGVANAGAPGSLTVRSSTLSSNSASLSGGGIAVLNSGIDLENTTLVGNDAQTSGGGIAYDNNDNTLSRIISFSTITSNTSVAGGSNVSAVGVPIDVTGTIFNDGVCAIPGSAINSLGGNLDSGNSCGLDQPTDLINTNPLLGSLQDNGGPVPTIELLAGSPAIDAALPPGPATDARGTLRPIDGDGDGDGVPDIGAFEAALVGAIDLGVDKTLAAGSNVIAGGTANFDMTVFNNGPLDATNVQLVDVLPAGLTFNGTAGLPPTANVTVTGQQVVIDFGTVVAGVGFPFQLFTLIDANQTADLTNTATVAGSETDSDLTNNTDDAFLDLPESDLRIDMVGQPDPVAPGNPLTYTILVTNDGPDQALGVTVIDVLPGEVTFVSGNVNGNASLVQELNPGEVTATVGTLADGESATIEIVVQVNANAIGPLNNTATVTADPNTDPDAANNTATQDTVVAPSTTTIVGHSFCDVNNNGVEDNGEATVGALVFLDANGNGVVDVGERTTITNATGDYQFDNVTDTEVVVTFEIPDDCNTINNQPLRGDLVLTRDVNTPDGVITQVGDLANALASVDIDNDDDLDLLVTVERSNEVWVLENEGGAFTVLRTIGVVDRPQSITVFQNPGDPNDFTAAVAGIGTPTSLGAVDILTANVIRGNTPNDPTDEIVVGNGPIDVVLEDLDLDGQLDVVAGSFRSSTLSVVMSDGTSTTVPTEAGQLFTITTGNVDPAEQAPQIIVSGVGFSDVDADDPRMEVFASDGSGSFAKIHSRVLEPTVVDILAADVITGDGGTDEILALQSNGLLTVQRFNGGVDVDPTVITAGASAFSVGDFNNDGQLDVAITNLNGQFVELFAGNGTGEFVEVTTIPGVSAPSDIIVEDFNGDGFGDVAVTNLYFDANAGTQDPPDLSLPSHVTLLNLKLVQSPDAINPGVVNEIDFIFPSADPEVLMDVSGDGLITALDALLVINELSRQTFGEGENPINVSMTRAVTDVNGDGRTSAIDALMIINELGRQSVSEGIAVDDLLADDDDDRDTLTEATDLVLGGDLF